MGLLVWFITRGCPAGWENTREINSDPGEDNSVTFQIEGYRWRGPTAYEVSLKLQCMETLKSTQRSRYAVGLIRSRGLVRLTMLKTKARFQQSNLSVFPDGQPIFPGSQSDFPDSQRNQAYAAVRMMKPWVKFRHTLSRKAPKIINLGTATESTLSSACR